MSTSEDFNGRDLKWFRFAPIVDITAKELAELLMHLCWAVDERIYVQLPEAVRRHFVEKESDESQG